MDFDGNNLSIIFCACQCIHFRGRFRICMFVPALILGDVLRPTSWKGRYVIYNQSIHPCYWGLLQNLELECLSFHSQEVLHVHFFRENRAKHKASCQWMHVSLFLLMDNYNISCIDCLSWHLNLSCIERFYYVIAYLYTFIKYNKDYITWLYNKDYTRSVFLASTTQLWLKRFFGTFPTTKNTRPRETNESRKKLPSSNGTANDVPFWGIYE